METKTMKELREIAKQRGLRGYYKLRRGRLLDAVNTLIHDLTMPAIQPTVYEPQKTHLLDSPVPDIQVPTIQPTAYKPLKSLTSRTNNVIRRLGRLVD